MNEQADIPGHILSTRKCTTHSFVGWKSFTYLGFVDKIHVDGRLRSKGHATFSWPSTGFSTLHPTDKKQIRLCLIHFPCILDAFSYERARRSVSSAVKTRSSSALDFCYTRWGRSRAALWAPTTRTYGTAEISEGFNPKDKPCLHGTN